MAVFITALASALPNAPVANDDMEGVLGVADRLPSRTRRIILRNNGIRQRYYAIDPATGVTTHTNAQLTAAAIRSLLAAAGLHPAQLDSLCCGTSSPDLLMPGHGLMVHGELGGGPCEVVTTAGICGSGMTALKYAYMNVALGLSQHAVATGSELASTFLRGSFCGSPPVERAEALERQPSLAFEADFLRWMLSDGAGAVLLRPAPAPAGLSLRVEWIEHRAFAHGLDTCMYAGGVPQEGVLRGWREFATPSAAAAAGAFLIKQDTKLLNREIISTAVQRTLPGLIEKYSLAAESIDWYLPHYSSEYFRGPLHQNMAAIGFDIPQERWFTNLQTKGNTGAASIYIMLDELFHSGRLRDGQRLLCMIPESGRFSMCYMMLTVVAQG